MTDRGTFDCDGPACEAEDLLPEFVKEIDVRLPSQRDPFGFRDPIRETLHFCEECSDPYSISSLDVEWVAVDNRDGKRVVGVQHRVRSGMKGDRYATFDERDSVVLSQSWEEFFVFVEDAIAGISEPGGRGSVA